MAMQEVRTFYLDKLREAFEASVRKNPQYSLRAFARDLGVNPATLSMALSGKRDLPAKFAPQVAAKLRLPPLETSLFVESVGNRTTALDKIKIKEEYFERYVIDSSYHAVIAEWEHYVVISLIETKGFSSDHSHIAARLGIAQERVDEVMFNLVSAGLVDLVDGMYSLTKGAPLRTSEDIPSTALKEAHAEELELARRKLDELDTLQRDFSSLIVPANSSKLPEAKKIIREFRQKMASLLKDGETDEVFCMSVQLYPMTKTLESP